MRGREKSAPLLPPASWYRKRRWLDRPAQNRKASYKRLLKPKPFPFLQLPREIRDMIYASYASSLQELRIPILIDLNNPYINWSAWPYIHKGVFPAGTEDNVHYRTNRHDDLGILAFHGALPPTNLLLVCKQIASEVLSRVAFEVDPLTSHDKTFRYSLDRTYRSLARSPYVALLSKIVVRIDLTWMQTQRKVYVWPSGVKEELWPAREISLAECVKKVQPRSRALCAVLGKYALNLRVVSVHWVDDFPDAVGEDDVGLKASVLEPFSGLKGVAVRIGKLVVAERGRAAAQAMIDQTLKEEVPSA